MIVCNRLYTTPSYMGVNPTSMGPMPMWEGVLHNMSPNTFSCIRGRVWIVFLVIVRHVWFEECVYLKECMSEKEYDAGAYLMIAHEARWANFFISIGLFNAHNCLNQEGALMNFETCNKARTTDL